MRVLSKIPNHYESMTENEFWYFLTRVMFEPFRPYRVTISTSEDIELYGYQKIQAQAVFRESEPWLWDETVKYPLDKLVGEDYNELIQAFHKHWKRFYTVPPENVELGEN